MEPFQEKVQLARPLMHGEEQELIKLAFDENYITTVGTNLDMVEKELAEKIGVKYVAALSCGTAALHLAIKMAALKVYGHPKQGQGSLVGKRVITV